MTYITYLIIFIILLGVAYYFANKKYPEQTKIFLNKAWEMTKKISIKTFEILKIVSIKLYELSKILLSYIWKLLNINWKVSLVSLSFVVIILFFVFRGGDNVPKQIVENSPQVNTEKPVKKEPVEIKVETKTIAEAVIGKEGGVVESKGDISIEFPEGSLPNNEKITVQSITTNIDNPLEGRTYSVEREGGHAPLYKDAKVSFDIPDGIDTSKLLVAQELGENSWVTLPSKYDSVTGKLTAEVPHFSSLFWKIVAGAGTAVVIAAGAAVAGATIVLTPITGTAAVVILAISTFPTGALLEKIYSEYSLNHNFTLGYVTAMWADEGKNAVKLESTDKRFIYVTDEVAEKNIFYIVPQDLYLEKDPKEIFYKLKNGVVSGYKVYDAIIPEKIITILSNLNMEREYLLKNGYNPPKETIVLFHNDLRMPFEKLLSFAGIKRTTTAYGIWDGTYINIKADLISGNNWTESLNTAIHEYWHSVYMNNWSYFSDQVGSYNQMFPWTDEAMASALEITLFPNSRSLDNLISFFGPVTIAPELKTGLIVNTESDDVIKRGYGLWPFVKYLIHTQDHGTIKDILSLKSGSNVPELIENLFIQFALSLITKDHELSDNEEIMYPWGNESVPTGWSELSLYDLMVGSNGQIDINNKNLSPLSNRPYPLSLSFFALYELDKLESPQKIVIRRKKLFPEEEIIALRPAEISAETEDPKTKTKSLGERRTLDDIIRGDGGVVVDDLEWFKNTNRMPFVLLGKNFDYEKSDNPLLVYNLQPPKDFEITDMGEKLWLDFQPPELGGGIKLEEVLKGYYPVVKYMDGQEKILRNVLIKTTEHNFELEKTRLGNYAKIGLVSVDAVMVDEEKKYLPDQEKEPLMSDVVWYEETKMKCDGGYEISIDNIPSMVPFSCDLSEERQLIRLCLVLKDGVIKDRSNTCYSNLQSANGTVDKMGNVIFEFKWGNYRTSSLNDGEGQSGEIVSGTFKGKFLKGACEIEGVATGQYHAWNKETMMCSAMKYDIKESFSGKGIKY